MTVGEVVEALGRERRVEQIVQNIARRPLSPDLRDLCQMVYEVILTSPEDRVLDLWEHGEINFYIVRIVLNQYRSASSAWFRTYRRPGRACVSIDGIDIEDTTGKR